jgi:copper(I)-binding protein
LTSEASQVVNSSDYHGKQMLLFFLVSHFGCTRLDARYNYFGFQERREMRKRSKTLSILGLVVILVLLLTACRAGSAGPQISIKNAWGRPSPKVATAGAFYMVIKNTGGQVDRLIAGSSPACQSVELHESYDLGEGVMGMRPVEGGVIEVPAGGQAELKMGGFHIMCIGKLNDFEEGAELTLNLEFEKSGRKTIDVEIHQPGM